MLSSEGSAEPGRWSTDRTPYLREFQDSFLDPDLTDVVGVFGSQLGKTEGLNNVLGYFIHRQPSPILFVQPTLSLARAWSKLRLVPMLRDTPALRELIGDPSAKTTGQEILEKSFPGGQLAIAGANAPGGLAGRPRRIVLGDELDRWPESAGSEGSPVELARKRTSTFWNRIHGWISSPGTAGASTIWPLWEISDQRRYWVPCPQCSERQWLKWSQVEWSKDADEFSAPESAVYVCESESCGAEWDDADRLDAIRRGEWRKGREGGTVAGFHLSALYSPWLELSELVREWIQAQGKPESLKVFINTRLAELWEEAVADVDVEELLRRREAYGPKKIPDDVLVVTAGVDVQDDRLELELVGWGRRGESWSLGYAVIYGDPEALLHYNPRSSEADSDGRLDDALSVRFEREDGVRLRVSAACIDSGGHHTESVYLYAKRREKRRFYAIKGRGGEGVPLWPKRATKSSRRGVGRVRVHVVGVDTGKSQLMHRLATTDPEKAGYCHFPDRAEYDEEYFAQLTGEAPAPAKYVRGKRQARIWKQIHPRVEALDCRVYASAALASLSPNWDRIETTLARSLKATEGSEPETAAEALELEAVDDSTPESVGDRIERDQLRRRRGSRARRLRPRGASNWRKQ